MDAHSPSTSNKILSAYRIMGVCQCVDELIFNAIDAGSSAIAVRFDLRKFCIQVIDNGAGMTISTLKSIGARLVIDF